MRSRLALLVYLLAFACTEPGAWSPSVTVGGKADDAVSLREAVGLPDDERGQDMAALLGELGYTEIETWRANLAAGTVGPDEAGLALPVLRNSAIGCVVILHETPNARRVWATLDRYVKFAGRFTWSSDLRDDAPEGIIIVRTGAAPYHLAEEHFHHQFSRANLIRLHAREYVSPDEWPRVGDSEAYAATMAWRRLADSEELADWLWNGQADIAGLFDDVDNASLLETTIEREIDLAPIAAPSRNNGDGLPNRPARSLGWLAMPENEAVNIDRFDSSTELDWDEIMSATIAWTDMDVASTGITVEDLAALK